MYIAVPRRQYLPRAGGADESIPNPSLTDDDPNRYFTLFKVFTIILLSIVVAVFILFLFILALHTYRIATGQPGLFGILKNLFASEVKRPLTLREPPPNPVVRRPLPRPPFDNGTNRRRSHPTRASRESVMDGEITMAQRVSVAYATPTISQRGSPSPSRFQLMTNLPGASGLLSDYDASQSFESVPKRLRSNKRREYRPVRQDSADVKAPLHASFGSPSVLVLPPTPSVPNAPRFDDPPKAPSSKYLRPSYGDDHVSNDTLLEVPTTEPGLYYRDGDGHQAMSGSEREVGRNAEMTRDDSLRGNQEFPPRAVSAFSDATELEVVSSGIATWSGIALSPSLASSLQRFTSHFSMPRLRRTEDDTIMPASRNPSKLNLAESTISPSSTQGVRGTYERTERRKPAISARRYGEVMAEMESLENPSPVSKGSPRYALDEDPFRRPSPQPGASQAWIVDPEPDSPRSDISMNMLVRRMMSTPSPSRQIEPSNGSSSLLPETPTQRRADAGRHVKDNPSSGNPKTPTRRRVSEKSLPDLPGSTSFGNSVPRPMNPTPTKTTRAPDVSTVSGAGVTVQGTTSAWSIGNSSGESELRRRPDSSRDPGRYHTSNFFSQTAGNSRQMVEGTPPAASSTPNIAHRPKRSSNSNSGSSQTDQRSRSPNLSEFPSPPRAMFGHHTVRAGPRFDASEDVRVVHTPNLPHDVSEYEDEGGIEVVIDTDMIDDEPGVFKASEASFTIEDYFEQDSVLGASYDFDSPVRYSQETLKRHPFSTKMFSSPRAASSSRNVKPPSRSPRKSNR